MKVIDLTYPITKSMKLYPGEPKPIIKKVNTVKKDGWCEHYLGLQTHVGTHMDAPMHMLAGGKGIDSYDPRLFFGSAVVVDCKEHEITSAPFRKAGIMKGDIVVVRTPEMKKILRRGYDTKRQPHLTLGAAEYLASKRAKMVCFAASGPGDGSTRFASHKLLLSRRIPIVESLVNTERLPKRCEIYALPLLVPGVDGAPARVIAVIR